MPPGYSWVPAAVPSPGPGCLPAMPGTCRPIHFASAPARQRVSISTPAPPGLCLESGVLSKDRGLAWRPLCSEAAASQALLPAHIPFLPRPFPLSVSSDFQMLRRNTPKVFLLFLQLDSVLHSSCFTVCVQFCFHHEEEVKQEAQVHSLTEQGLGTQRGGPPSCHSLEIGPG